MICFAVNKIFQYKQFIDTLNALKTHPSIDYLIQFCNIVRQYLNVHTTLDYTELPDEHVIAIYNECKQNIKYKVKMSLISTDSPLSITEPTASAVIAS